MTIRIDDRRTLIRMILTRHAESGADVNIFLAIETWARVVASFTTLLGGFSVGLIYSRCLELNCGLFPWLKLASEIDKLEANLTALQRSLTGRSADEVIEACCAVMATFGEILDALIGEHLTTKYLHASLAVITGIAPGVASSANLPSTQDKD